MWADNFVKLFLPLPGAPTNKAWLPGVFKILEIFKRWSRAYLNITKFSVSLWFFKWVSTVFYKALKSLISVYYSLLISVNTKFSIS